MKESRQRNSSPGGITVIAPARLHMGFIDLNGSQGRHFGGLGLGIEELSVEVHASPASGIEAIGADADRARAYAERMLADQNAERGVHLQVLQAIPPHAGLGSGTQLALAVGAAISRLYDLPYSTPQIAALLDRGARSGIGIGSFMQGGFIVDAGHGANTEAPPVVSRLHFPDSWRLLLIQDPDCKGISGTPEKTAFDSLAPMPASVAEHLSWLVLMRVLPALVERDCTRFGAGISEIQALIGDHFAPVQGGRFSSPGVARAVSTLQDAGAEGGGQSSWGPTGFAIFSSETQAHKAIRSLREQQPQADVLNLLICRGRNRPAEIRHAAGATEQRQQRRGG